MKDLRIVGVFVSLSMAIWIFTSFIIAALPFIGFEKFINTALHLHPGDIIFAALPLAAIYVKGTTQPINTARGLKLAVIALIFLLPLSVLAESLKTWAVILSLHKVGYFSILPADPTLLVVSGRSLFVTAVVTLIGLTLIFPARVKRLLRN
ncbi:hypothetical protein GGI64_006578 [Rhizobium leguminosarum]|uniref:Uncharacterized protein n=1 Tax=Rhizobium leguminosarum TaxID=384 RepID=A0A7Z0E5S5_RHILE|nr:hypothetical protein [Rhizobium leguminosarum]NYJ15466.1 hypothetical protein [Rhizobium leguminosarum]